MSQITQVRRIPLSEQADTLDATITQYCQAYQTAGLSLSTSFVHEQQLVLIFQTPLPTPNS